VVGVSGDVYYTVGNIGGISRGTETCTVQYARSLLLKGVWDMVCLNKC
jgi:hypothetical protein